MYAFLLLVLPEILNQEDEKKNVFDVFLLWLFGSEMNLSLDLHNQYAGYILL